MVRGASPAFHGRALFAPSLALTFGRLRRSGALPARLVSRARDATGIAQAPTFAPGGADDFSSRSLNLPGSAWSQFTVVSSSGQGCVRNPV